MAKIKTTPINDDLNDIPIARKEVRVRMLVQAARRAESNGDDALMARFLEQISKEIGGFYESTRRLEVTGKSGRPVQMITAAVLAEIEAALDNIDTLSGVH